MRRGTITALKSNAIVLCGLMFSILNARGATAQQITPVSDSQVTNSQASNSQGNETKAANRISLPANELPDSPGTTLSKSKPETLRSALVQSIDKQSSSPDYLTQDIVTKNADSHDINDIDAQQNSLTTPQAPVGTAAAGVNHVSGVAAAQPTGVAMATGKQRRVRTIVLRVGAIVGAGVAVGSVVALSEGTPSKPPGAH
jgi:hypothetical protein